MPLYSLGSNGSGQLGIGHKDDVSVPALVNLPPELRHAAIVSIRAGGNHTLLQTSSIGTHCTGENNNGRCVIQDSETATFKSCTMPKTRLLAATWEASIFVSEDDGFVRVCGTGLKGELGLGASTSNTNTPTRILDFPPSDLQVVDLAACLGHVVVVLSNGEVWGWGNGQQGQLGDPTEVVWRPRKFEAVQFKAVRAVCGKDFTAVFGDQQDGNVVIFGVKKRDRFGVQANAPSAIPGWIDVQATWGGVYVLMRNGDIIAWGRDDHGQLPPTGTPKASAIAAGSEHIVVLTNDSRVLVWGWGEHGNCGEPVDERKDVKGRCNELDFDGEAIAVGAGCATSWIITQT